MMDPGARKILVSVVIPTFHRPDLLHRCLDGLLRQYMPAVGFEIIVVDDGHDDATRAMVQSIAADCLPRLLYLRPEAGKGPSVARNTGWRAARAPLVAFTDDDTIPQPGWLQSGERAMRVHPGWSALCGRVHVPLDPASRACPTDHELMTMGLETAEFVTANAFVRRDALIAVGGFDEDFKRAWREDSDLQFRLMQCAGPVGKSEDALVLHPVRAERWGVCLRQQKNAFFDALLYKKHPHLYRERLHPSPPLNYYGIVVAILAALVGAGLGRWSLALASGALAAVLIARVAARRLRNTSHARAHVLEMLATSALIPFLSVYWRLRGAIRFRVLFL
jgi:glycosyltransferase involved in cell wall biosynthesis